MQFDEQSQNSATPAISPSLRQGLAALATLAVLAVPGCRNDTASLESGPPALDISGPPARREGVYIWDSTPFIADAAATEKLIERVRALGMSRLMISFGPEQVAKLERKDYFEKVSTFVKTASGQGLEVELLLGEPTWILPEGRQALLRTVNAFRDLPFSSIHLDLEPNQLSPSYDEDYLLKELVKTVGALDRATDSKITLSVHPRYLDDERFMTCLACELPQAGVSELTLMIYSSDPATVIEVASPMMTKFPGLRFSVAQSFETILSPEESYAFMPAGEASDRLKVIRAALSRHENFSGVVIQAFEYLGGREQPSAFQISPGQL